ncbi:hypothetical protein BGZ60DRAFT_435693 [Tricladium varicosporioides]|nr:hypothetical protein BGZ60DRAFT_435693 [Hymenoscyphus varicosporioides]
MTKNWKDVRPEFKRLYVTERRPLEEVRSLLKAKYGFEASPRAYKNKIDEYGWKKYKKCSRLALVPTEAFKQGREASLSATIVASDRTRLRGLEQLIEQQLSTFKQEKNLILSTGEFTTQISHEKRDTSSRCLQNENITRIKNTIQSLEDILLQVAQQLNAPRGFESCWRLEPMVLEDAHGSFVMIPLDVVVSWQDFDDVLETHFRLLPGTRKVARREYSIEDSATCTEFSRNHPWVSYCKPGIKIDMSMVFKDINKLNATCPKCNTVSEGKRGVMVECKHPSCKMLFRTEEDEDTRHPAHHAERKRAGSPTSNEAFISPTTLEVVPLEMEEEKPSLFKRVIMRIRKNSPLLGNKRQKATLSTKHVSKSLEKDVEEAWINSEGWVTETSEIDWDEWDSLFKLSTESKSTPPLWEAPNATSNNRGITESNWEGISEENFIKDKIIPAGTSPLSSQSPSSYSYHLPKPVPDFTCNLLEQKRKMAMKARQEQNSTTASHNITPYPNGAIDIRQSFQGATLDALCHTNLQAHQRQPTSLVSFMMSTNGSLSDMPSYEDFSVSLTTASEGYSFTPLIWPSFDDSGQCSTISQPPSAYLFRTAGTPIIATSPPPTWDLPVSTNKFNTLVPAGACSSQAF